MPKGEGKAGAVSTSGGIANREVKGVTPSGRKMGVSMPGKDKGPKPAMSNPTLQGKSGIPGHTPKSTKPTPVGKEPEHRSMPKLDVKKINPKTI